MEYPRQPELRRPDRSTLFLVAALCMSALALATVLVLVLFMGLRGLTINVTGTVLLSEGSDPVEVRLTLEQPIPLVVVGDPVQLVVGGADGGAIPAEFSFGTCPECGGTRLPLRWNLWTGQIEWACASCQGADQRRGP